MQARTLQNDTLDALIWRHFGDTAGYVERTLELNPALARHGAVLPGGILVSLPDAKSSTANKKDIVQLWD